MDRILLLFCGLLLTFQALAQQVDKKSPRIVACDCRFKMDSSYLAIAPPAIRADSLFIPPADTTFKTSCGYLLVPENRSKPDSKTIRLPFIVVKSKNPHKRKDPVLFTSGGPGNSSLRWASGITRSTLIQDRDCIAFEQRGTRFALPYLRRFALDEAIREAYRYNLPKDSMILEGVKRYKRELLDQGIDLAGYNSYETVQDIGDLLTALQIDSVNLFGGSYSGGLMMGVLQEYPNKVRSLVLDSPLPTFVPIDEDEPFNFIEALKLLAEKVAKDSLDQHRYGDLWGKFDRYFRSITSRTFYQPYLPEGETDTLLVAYTTNDLLLEIVGTLLDHNSLAKAPYMITEIISGRHSAYILPRLRHIFQRNPAPDGMRISVYCADQQYYHRQDNIKRLYQLYPYLEGFRINDVYPAMCDCWDVPPVAPVYKSAFYSDKPVLLADGAMDAACSPLYLLLMQHYLPSAQSFRFTERSHGVGGAAFYQMTQHFLDHPLQKIPNPDPKTIINSTYR